MWNNITWFFRRLKRVWDFLPIIWKGYDFDYWYSIELFRYQLERTANQIEKSDIIVDAPHVVSRIRTAVRLIDIVYKEKYLDDIDWDNDEELKNALDKTDKAERILWKFIEHNIRQWWD